VELYDLGESEDRLARAHAWNPTDSKTMVADVLIHNSN